MSSIYIRNAKNKIWYYKTILPNGRPKYVSLKTTDKKLAQFTQKELDCKYERVRVGLDRPKVDIFAFMKEYRRLRDPYLKPTSQERYRKIVEHLEGYFREERIKYLDEITKSTATEYAAYRSGFVSNATINMELDLLRSALYLAEEKEYIHRNPLKRFKRLREHDTKSELKFYNVDEFRRLKVALPGEWQDFFLVIVYTGMRASELLNLQPEDIHDLTFAHA